MLKIYEDSNKVLREVCSEVTLPLNEDDEKLLLEMLDYLKKSQDDDYCQKHKIRSGVGLAAPQVGVSKKMFAVYYQDDDGKIVSYCLVNPKITTASAKLCALRGGEGCLSVAQDKKGYVYRYNKVIIKAYDLLQKKEVFITAKGYKAIVLQHELDHLSGILYYDRINKSNPFEIKENSELI